jgi:type III pantothenate kinase
MRLLVDIGNSRVKSAIDDDGELRPLETFAWQGVFLHEVLARHWISALEHDTPTSVHVSNVAGDRLLPNMKAWCVKNWGLEPVSLEKAAEFQGLVNGYSDPQTLGADRWAAMIGARQICAGPLCVVDSGTATTVDVIDETGQHIGGAILPGIYTMRRSLGKYTAALFAADTEIGAFADNTASGIAGGTGFASVGAVDRFVREAELRVGPVTTILTGGESEILQSFMLSASRRDPLLVLRGIKAVADAAAG